MQVVRTLHFYPCVAEQSPVGMCGICIYWLLITWWAGDCGKVVVQAQEVAGMAAKAATSSYSLLHMKILLERFKSAPDIDIVQTSVDPWGCIETMNVSLETDLNTGVFLYPKETILLP